MRDMRSLGLGLLLGVCVMIAVGQAAAPNHPDGTRYEVTPSYGEGGNYEFFIHDRQTNKVYHRTLGNGELRPDGTLVEDILKHR